MENRFKDEVWKDIEGYFGYYQVSNMGRVKSLDRFIEQRRGDGSIYNRKISGRMLSLNKTNGSGYHVVSLQHGIDGCKNYYIHRLVAVAFIENIENLKEVNHKDENKSNNIAENLEWCDRKYNSNYGTKISRFVDTFTEKYRTDKDFRQKLIDSKKEYYSTHIVKGTEVEIDGIRFESITRCAKYCNVDRRKMNGWLNSIDKMPEEYILRGLKKIKIKKEVSDSIY